MTIKEDYTKEGPNNNRWIEDVTNHIISIHHFSKNMVLDEAKNQFSNIMKKRFIRLNDKLKACSNLVVISNRSDALDKKKSSLQDFSNIYPHLKTEYNNIINKEIQGFEKFCYFNNGKLSLKEYCFNDSFDYQTGKLFDNYGNIHMWNKGLEPYTCFEIESILSFF